MLYLTERLLLGYDTWFSNSFSNYQTNSRLLCFLSWSGQIPARTYFVFNASLSLVLDQQKCCLSKGLQLPFMHSTGLQW